MIKLKNIKCKCGSRKIELKRPEGFTFDNWIVLCPDCRRRVYEKDSVHLLGKALDVLQTGQTRTRIVSVLVKPYSENPITGFFMRIIKPDNRFRVSLTFLKYPPIIFPVRDMEHLIWELESCMIDPITWMRKYTNL